MGKRCRSISNTWNSVILSYPEWWSIYGSPNMHTWKMSLSTALGMTETLVLRTPDLSTVFSLPVWETQIQWSIFAKQYLKNVFVTMALASANPNKEWSVKTVFRPNRLPTKLASWASVEKAECPWTIWICSCLNMYLKKGSDPTMVGSTAFF